MSAPIDTWPSLIAELQDTALGDIQTPCSSEEEFRANFESTCEENSEPDAQRLLGRFVRQHVAIIAFTGTIDAAQSLLPPETLSDLFWQIAFATIEVCLSQNTLRHLIRR